jgi:enediyne biosynthesis thioesterase
MFLREHAPDIAEDLSLGLSLATVRCSCEYFTELNVFDEVLVRMRLAGMAQNRLTLSFEYWRARDGQEELVARGEQQIACMARRGGALTPTPVPPSLQEALAPYAAA